MNRIFTQRTSGFTITELIIIIVVLGILATLSVFGYNVFTKQTAEASLQSNLQLVSAELESGQHDEGGYPEVLSGFNEGEGLPESDKYDYVYESNGENFCLIGTSKTDENVVFSITQTGVVSAGPCTLEAIAEGGGGGGGGVANGTFMQEIDAAECTTTRVWVEDARDSHTYWMQELPDGICWMLTDLAYAGGGYGGWDDYNDSRSILNGTGLASSFTNAYYYIPPGATATVDPQEPSSSTNGTGQYGYLYNWCGAMGGQANAACDNATTPAPLQGISACPQGWRLPTSAEFTNLNNVINGGSDADISGLTSTFLAQLQGTWNSGFSSQGYVGAYWTGTQAAAAYADQILFEDGFLEVSYDTKTGGRAIRCVNT